MSEETQTATCPDTPDACMSDLCRNSGICEAERDQPGCATCGEPVDLRWGEVTDRGEAFHLECGHADEPPPHPHL